MGTLISFFVPTNFTTLFPNTSSTSFLIFGYFLEILLSDVNQQIFVKC
jgi:hypothetical protein